MKLYKIHPDTDPNVVGTYPQVEIDSGLKPYHVNWPNSYLKIPMEGPVPFELHVPFFKLVRNAKRTDLLNCTAVGFFRVVSSAFLEFVSKYKNHGIEVYDTIVTEGNRKLNNYHFIRFPNSMHEAYLDYPNTVWAVVSPDPHKIGNRIIRAEFSEPDRDVLNRRVKKIYQTQEKVSVVLKKLKLRDVEYDDLFLCNMGAAGGIFFSERLKEAIVDAGFTGMRFEEYYDTNQGARIFEINT